MKIIAVSNQKGGVGKTTTVVNVAGLLVHHGFRALMIDLDPHGSLTSYFGSDPDDVDGSVFDLFMSEEARADPGSIIMSTGYEHLDVIRASTAQATLDRQLGTKSGMGLVLANAIKSLNSRYDYVFFDCPPMLGVLMVNALAACQQLLVPVQTEFLALKGLERMIHTLGMVEKSLHKSLPYTIVPTMFDRRTRASVQTLREFRQRFEEHIWQGVIPVDTQFREASKAGVPLSIKKPWAKGVQAYRKLVEDINLEVLSDRIPAGLEHG